MKLLVVVRHGQYGKDGRLDDRGRLQIDALAEKLKPLINGASVFILTSPTDRTCESAEILGHALGAPIEEHEVLWSEDSRPENFPGALALVRSRSDKALVLILVTHFEYAEGFPTYFAKMELGIQLRSRLIKTGEAWVLDCQQKTLTHVA